MEKNCWLWWWFRNPANQLIGSFPIISKVLDIPGGAGFLPSTVFLRKLFGKVVGFIDKIHECLTFGVCWSLPWSYVAIRKSIATIVLCCATNRRFEQIKGVVKKVNLVNWLCGTWGQFYCFFSHVCVQNVWMKVWIPPGGVRNVSRGENWYACLERGAESGVIAWYW